MSQTIELADQDLEKLDKLVKTGLFLDRQQVVKASLESLLQLPEEDIKKMKQVQAKINGYCDSHLGNMLGAGAPFKIAINDKEYFKVPIKGEYEGKVYTYGYLFVDAMTLTIDEQLSDSREKIHQTARELTSYDEIAVI